MPVVGVVLDCFNALNFALHLFVALLEVVVVAVSVRMTVTSHDFNYYRALVIISLNGRQLSCGKESTLSAHFRAKREAPPHSQGRLH